MLHKYTMFRWMLKAGRFKNDLMFQFSQFFHPTVL